MKRILAFLLACSMVLCLMGCQTSPETSISTQGQLETPSTPTSDAPDTQPTTPDQQPTTPVHVHTWKDATCVRPRSCAECGQTEGVPQGHNWLDATTTAPKTCSVCGAQDGDVIFDIPEDVPVFIPENECFEENTTVIVDAITGGESMERIDAVMEDYAEKYVAYSFTATKDEEIVQPTGKLTVTFAIPEGYSDHVTVFYVAEDGTLEKLEGTVDPVARTITVELSHFSDYIVVDEGSAEHEHAPVAGATSAPTCVDPGYTTYSCDCGYTYLADRVEPTGHSYGRGVITEPSCTQDGKTTYTCHCGHSYENPIPATGHNWNDATCTDPRTCSVCKFTEGTAPGHTWVDANCTDPKTCSVCQATEGDPLGHTWADPTCTDPKTCSVCQATDGDPLGHKWMDANCTTAKTCSVCQATDGNPLGHKWTDANCTSPKTCSVCQATEGTVTEHPWDEGVVTKEATEEAEGEKLYTCTTCKTTRTEVIPKLDHVHLYDKVEVTAPTCTEKGFTTHTCRCGDTKVDTETPATGHSYESKVTAPTCTEKGYTTHTCHCGDTYTDAETAATGHSWKDATCTEVKKCTICQATEGAALGHSWKAATCTEPETCSRCAAQQGKPRGHSCEEGTCAYCGITLVTYSKGLEFRLSDDETYYILRSIGTCTDTAIIIPPTYNGLPVVEIRGLDDWREVGKEDWETLTARIKAITSITIPDSVTSINDFSFYSCENLKEIILTGNASFIFADGILYDNPATRIIWVSKQGPQNVTILDGVTQIGNSAFMKRQNLVSIAIPDSVTTIGSSAFSGCKELKEIILSSKAKFTFADGILYDNPVTKIIWVSNHLPANLTVLNGVTSLGTSFRGCSSLSGITLPSSITSIDTNAFYNCKNLTNIMIPNSVTTISARAFAGCTSLSSITIPDSVITISGDPFSGCTNLRDIILSPDANFRFEGGILYDNPVRSIVWVSVCISGDVTILDGVYDIDQNTGFRNRSQITSITIPRGITDIEAGSFEGCTSIKKFFVKEGETYSHFCADEHGVLYRGKTLIAVPHRLSGAYVIPEGVTVSRGAFANLSGLISVTIPYSAISTINFSGCAQLRTVNFTGSSMTQQTLPGYCFEGCTSLTQIILPYGITTIRAGAFSGCTNLEQIVLPQSLTEIGNYAFFECTKLKSIVIPKKVEEIGSEAFNGCSQLTTVAFAGDAPNGMSNVFVEVNSNAYYPAGNSTWTSEKTQNYGGTITWKTYDPVADGQFEYVLSSNGSYYILAGMGTYNQLSVVIPSAHNGLPVREIAMGVFAGNTQMTDITIPGSISRIGNSTFCGCTALINVTMLEGITAIGNNAFQGCTSLKDVTIPGSVTEIGAYSFDGCTALTNVTLEKGVKTIGTCAFDRCTKLTSITIPDSVTSIESSALGSNLKEVHITDLRRWLEIEFGGYTANPLSGKVQLYLDGDLVCSTRTGLWIGGGQDDPLVGTGEFTIPEGTTKIGSYALYGFPMSILTIPESVKSASESSFEGCKNLERIVLVKDHSFRYADGILYDNPVTKILWISPKISGYITILNGVTSIPYGAFGNTNITGITIPESVTSIEGAAFAGSAITSIVIPDSVTSMGAYVFSNCAQLVSVKLPKNLTMITLQMFEKCVKLESITIPDGVTIIEDQAFVDCDSLKTITIPGSVVTIDMEAFLSCDNLTEVIIEEGVERIEWFAFKNCTKLTSVIIPTSVTWMPSAFCNTRNLTITYLGTKAQWKKVGTGCCVNEIEGSEEGQLETYKVPVKCKDGTI